MVLGGWRSESDVGFHFLSISISIGLLDDIRSPHISRSCLSIPPMHAHSRERFSLLHIYLFALRCPYLGSYISLDALLDTRPHTYLCICTFSCILSCITSCFSTCLSYSPHTLVPTSCRQFATLNRSYSEFSYRS